MSSLSMVEAKLPAGFRFHPKDEELVCDYLWNKVSSCSDDPHHPPPLMIEVDLNKCEPWDIPEMACVGGKDWYFYSQRDRKYATGLRTNRATLAGYWKATGKDKPVVRKGCLVGMRKTLVFYKGRAPKGKKSDWVMHEFRLEGPLAPPNISSTKEDWVLCRVFHKNKEVATKQELIGTGGYKYDQETITSSSLSLPPLMEPYIAFDQTNPHSNNTLNHQYNDEQVPCFSIFTPNYQTTPTFSQITQPNLPISKSTPIMLGGFGDINNDNNNNNGTCSSISSDCDKKVLKAVLDQITKMESNQNVKESPSFCEGSSGSFLSEVGLPAMWNQYSF